ncbi:Ral GTPase-activating protein subunit alpha-1 [Thelohanellus kitauei]|uniref:Ral GTPase-activating protein subunit alpha-1 n=1 Tax=Thelohanellus kitauei TaxID=669202 RepID=A0A0C2MSE7_THEKT|nr:Ral GTPase-activating protein subunit alpha-1 [Thelohanellus kitauei]
MSSVDILNGVASNEVDNTSKSTLDLNIIKTDDVPSQNPSFSVQDLKASGGSISNILSVSSTREIQRSADNVQSIYGCNTSMDFNDDLEGQILSQDINLQQNLQEESDQTNIKTSNSINSNIYMMWKRFLGIFGNLNNLRNEQSQISLYNVLCDVFQLMENVSKNMGLNSDLKYTPPQGKRQPDLLLFFPLALQTMLMKYSDIRVKSLAQKLAIRSFLTQYNFVKTPNMYKALFTEWINITKSQNEPQLLLDYFIHAPSLFSLDIEGSSMLICPILQIIDQTLNNKAELPEGASTLMLSICSYFYSFPDLQIDENVHINDKFWLYLKTVLKCAVTCNSYKSRCIYLSCLSQIIVENIKSKSNINIIRVLFSVISKHLYSQSISLVSFTVSILSFYTSFLVDISDMDPSLPNSLFSYLCKAICNIRLIHTNTDARFNLYNSLIRMMHIVTNYLFTLSTPFSLAQYVKIFDLAITEEPKTMNISTSDWLFGFDDIDEEIILIIEQIHDVALEPGAENDDLIKNQIASELSSSGATYASVVSERQKTFNTYLQSLADFCQFFLFNFPILTGPESISCFGNEQDVFANNSQSGVPECLVLCLQNQVIISILELSETSHLMRKPSISPINIDDSTNIALMIVRSPFGKYVWRVQELNILTQLISQSKEFLFVSQLEGSETVSSDTLKTLIDTTTETFRKCHKNKCYEEQKCSTVIPKLKYNANLLKRMETPISVKMNPILSNQQFHHLPSQATIDLEEQQKSIKNRLFSKIACQIGMFSNDFRHEVSVLNPTERFYRDMKQLDNRLGRSGHKIAVFYVPANFEDRDAIIATNETSQNFSSFLLGMGWVVETKSHMGFLGGLVKSPTKDLKAIYYCSPVDEAIFHVSPFMPSDEQSGGLIYKMRHLGNDEIQIVWSEHYRPFRRGIINTEFGDVIIAIYPLKNGLFRINILKKPEVPEFGPLCDGSVVPFSFLPALVRETAINASHSTRMSNYLYKTT